MINADRATVIKSVATPQYEVYLYQLRSGKYLVATTAPNAETFLSDDMSSYTVAMAVFDAKVQNFTNLH